MAETRTEFWHRRGRELHGMRKAELIALYRKLGGLGGTYPPEKWTKDEVLTSVADIEWRRLPDDAKKAAPEQMSPPCDECGKGQDVAAHAYGGSHHYVVTNDPCKPWVPSREYCAAPGCGRPYEHHRTWSLGHEYQAPAEEQPVVPADATAGLTEWESDLVQADAEGRVPEAAPDGYSARWIERPSGPPVRVDGPGCTPATVREFRPCDDCTTPFTCEEGGEDRCP